MNGKTLGCLLFVLIVFLSLAPQAISQTGATEEQGLKPYDSLTGSEIDSISMTNGSLSLQIPLASFPQRGTLGLSFFVRYSSNAWTVTKSCEKNDDGTQTCTSYWMPSSPVSQWGPEPVSSMDWRFILAKGGSTSVQSPDGGSHTFGGNPGYSLDGTMLYYVNNSSTGATSTITSPNGTTYSYLNTFGNQPISVTDANGNQITLSSSGWSDTMGRSIPGSAELCTWGSSNGISNCSGSVPIQPGVATSDLTNCPAGTASAMVWNVPGLGSGVRQYKFCYSNITLQTNFQTGSIVEYSGTALMLTAIVLPDLTTWLLQFDNYGSVSQLTFPTGGSISYQYANGNLLLCPAGTSHVNRQVSARIVNANDGNGGHTTNYSFPPGSNSLNNIVTYTNTVTSPDGNDTVYTVQNPVPGSFCNLYTVQTQSYQGSAQTGTLLRTTNTQYGSAQTFAPPTGGLNGVMNVVPTQTSVTLPNGKTSKTILTYDTTSFLTGPGGVALLNAAGALQSDEYDFSGNLYRSTFNHYAWQDNTNYKSANLLTLRTSSTTKDAAGNQTAQTIYGYDETNVVGSGASLGLVAPPALVRGNLTTVSRWVDKPTSSTITTTSTYFDTGLTASSTDALKNTTTYSYSGNFANAYLTQTNMPDTQMPDAGAPVVHHVVSAIYDYNTGLMTSFTDENGNSFTYQYDPATLRLKTANHPDGGQTTFNYPNATTVERQRLITGNTHDDSFVYFDGLGRPVQSQMNTPTCTVLADTAYDSAGRVASVSNPYCQGTKHDSDPTYGLTQTQYDALGRVRQITRPDNSVAKMEYDSDCTTTTDETGRQKKACSDAFGRLIEIDEAATYSPAVAASGSDAVSGTEQTAQVLIQPATAGSGSVGINGAVQWKTVTSATTGGTTNITITGAEQQNPTGVIPGTATISIGGSEQTLPATYASGSVTINANVQSTDRSTTITNQNATSATATITIGGSDGTNTKAVQVCSSTSTGLIKCPTSTSSFADTGTLTITVNAGGNNYTSSSSYCGSSTVCSGASSPALAANLAAGFPSNSLFSAKVSSSNASQVVLTAAAGAAGNNYSLTTSAVSNCANSQTTSSDGTTTTTITCGTQGWSFSPTSGSLSGGQNQVTQTVYDSGTVSLTIGGHNDQVSFGQNDTANTIASNLALNINQDSAALVTASVVAAAPNVVNLRAKSVGQAGNLTFSQPQYSYNTTYWSTPNFTATSSGSALSGGRDQINDSGTLQITANNHTTTPATQWGQNSTPASIASDLATKINADSGASVTATASGSNGPYRIQLSGGSYWYKYYADFGMSQPGVTYTVQVAVRNNGPAIVQVSSNLNSTTIAPGATQNVVLNFNGNGISDVQLIFGTVNTTADPLDITVWNPYVANVANRTNLVSSSQATFSGAGWYSEPGVNVSVASDTRYAFLNLTAKTPGTVANYPFSIASTYDSTDFGQSSFTASTANGLGKQFVPISPAMLSSNGFGNEYYSGEIVDGYEGCCGWGTDSSTAGAWLRIDLGAGNAQAVTQLRIYASTAGYAGNYFVYYSDDASTWRNIFSGFYPSQAGWNVASWSYAGAHRYWQLYLANTPGPGSWLTELQLIAQNSQTLALTGGWPNPNATDSGTMKVAINNNNYSVNWGQNDTTSTIASNLYTALSADPAVTATLAGSTILLAPKQSTYSFSTAYTFDSQDFSKSSFTPNSQISDYGTAAIAVGGHSDQVSWGGSDSSSTIAASLARVINGDSAAVVNATASGGTISLTARTTGSNTDYTLASSVTFDSTNFGGSSFAPSSSGTALAGGGNAVYNTVYDSGQVTLTVNGPNGAFQVSAPYQQGSTSSSIAAALANAINTTSGSPVTATVSGSTINITATQGGTASDYAWSAASSTSQGANFAQPSFTPSLSGNTLSGGVNAVTGSLATSWQTLYSYDTRNNLTCVEQHGGVNGTGCSADPGNDATSPWRVRRFTYDSIGHLLTSKNPENGSMTYQYDGEGRLSTRTDARGNTVTYQYRDTANGGVRLTDIIHSDSTPASRLRYDYSSYNGVSLSNPIGRLVATLSDNGAKYLTGFDKMGRPITAEQCTPGVTNCQNFSAGYDLLGDVTSLGYPNGFQVSYTYDAAARLTSAQDNAGFTYASTQIGDFLAAGMLKQFETPKFNYQVSYNNRLQPVEISAGTFFDKQYNYNPGADNGDVISITNKMDDGRSQAFAYDSVNRLISAGDKKNWSNSYVYDPWGNLYQKNPGAPSGENLQVLADSTNHLQLSNTNGSSVYTYDANGNLLTDGFHTYTYDAENRIATVDGATAYTYDGAGRRVAKSSGEHTWYGPTGGFILAQTDAGGNWTNYVYWASRRLARNVPQPAPNPPDIKYYVSDHLGSTAMLVDQTGTVIDDNDFFPWGGVIQQVGVTQSTNHFTFTGKERDGESSLDYFGARYYSNILGRWTSADWSAVPAPVPYASFGDPQTLNLNAYVRNVPTVDVDPDGHASRHSYLPAPLSITPTLKIDNPIQDPNATHPVPSGIKAFWDNWASLVGVAWLNPNGTIDFPQLKNGGWTVQAGDIEWIGKNKISVTNDATYWENVPNSNIFGKPLSGTHAVAILTVEVTTTMEIETGTDGSIQIKPGTARQTAVIYSGPPTTSFVGINPLPEDQRTIYFGPATHSISDQDALQALPAPKPPPCIMTPVFDTCT